MTGPEPVQPRGRALSCTRCGAADVPTEVPRTVTRRYPCSCLVYCGVEVCTGRKP